jgi:glutathione synthase
MESAQQRGHRVHVTQARDLSVKTNRATARCNEIRLKPATLRDGVWRASENWYEITENRTVALNAMDAILMRTDPPVNSQYLRATYILDHVDTSHTLLVNDPAGLRNANEKLFTLRFPQLIPETMVSADRAEILTAVQEWNRAVLKPTDAMAGRGVLLMRAGDVNLGSLIDSATAFGTQQIIVQRYVPENEEGDRRVIVLGGEPVGAIRRVAAPGEFRCNMAAGASVHQDQVTEIDQKICADIAPELARLGIEFAGIDILGDRLIEVNVTSPTGVREIDALGGTGLAHQIINHLENNVRR